MTTGCWSLTKCHLDGPFDFTCTPSLFPVSLEHLTLHPNPSDIDPMLVLDEFSRFPNLQHLQIDLGIPTGFPIPVSDTAFFLNEPLPSLKSLFLTPYLLCIPNDLEATTVLPIVQHLAVHVEQSMAKDLFNLVQLEYLSLIIFIDQGRVPYKQHVLFKVPHSVEKLRLTGPEHPDLEVTVQIPMAINISCRHIDNVICNASKQQWRPFDSELH